MGIIASFMEIFEDYDIPARRCGGGLRVDCSGCDEWAVFKKTSSSPLNLKQCLEEKGWGWYWYRWYGETQIDAYKDRKWLCPPCAKEKRQSDEKRRKAEQELISKRTIEY